MSDKTTAFYAAIDADIRETVRLLRDNGWNTTSSCQGGDGHHFARPTIELELHNVGDAEDLATLLITHGHPQFKIDVTLQVPEGAGFWVRRATVTLGEWIA